MSRARIGLDARLTRQLSAGMQTYVRELVARLPSVAPEYAYVTFERGGNFGFAEQVKLPRAMRRAKLDLIHLLSQYAPVFVPRPFVVTIHDLIHLRFPQYFKSKVGPYYATVVRRTCARASRVITDDERTIDDLREFLGVDPAKVRVIPLGAAEAFQAGAEPRVRARAYVLYVGNHREHKDLTTLFDAWSALPETLEVDLLVTGPDDFAGELQRRRRSGREIVALGDVSTTELAAYYAGARAFVMPALREGFGLPILEAMTVGCPVVACEDAVPRPLAAAALRFSARDGAQLRGHLERLLGDEVFRREIVERGRHAASALTWDRCARATADVYGEVLQEC